MAKLIKVNETTAYRVAIIQMGINVKGEPKRPKLLSIRKMYKTKKNPDWMPAYSGITIDLSVCARVIKAMIAVFKDSDPEVEIIEEKKGKKK